MHLLRAHGYLAPAEGTGDGGQMPQTSGSQLDLTIPCMDGRQRTIHSQECTGLLENALLQKLITKRDFPISQLRQPAVSSKAGSV